MPADQEIHQCETATLTRGKKIKMPIRDSVKAKEKELGTDSKKRNKNQWIIGLFSSYPDTVHYMSKTYKNNLYENQY